MSLHSRPLIAGKLRGVIYDFDFPGDPLPWHTHEADTVHISIIALGSFDVRGVGWELVAEQGQTLDFEPGAHEFVARTANSRLINIIKA